MAMIAKTVKFKRGRAGDVLRVLTPLGYVDITIGLSDEHGSAVVRVETQPDEPSRVKMVAGKNGVTRLVVRREKKRMKSAGGGLADGPQWDETGSRDY